MIKQSRHSITFIKAQYQSIYTRAYIKGLASVMVLGSTSLLANYAQAANINVNGNDWNNAGDFDASSHTEHPEQSNEIYVVSGSFDNINANDSYDVNLTEVQLKGELNIAAGSTVNMTGQDRTLHGWDEANGQTDADAVGSLKNSGEFNIGSVNTKDQAFLSKVTLDSGSTTTITGNATTDSAIGDYSTLTAGLGQDGSLKAASGSTINLKQGSNLAIGAGATEATIDGNVNFGAGDGHAFIHVQDQYDNGSWRGEGNTTPTLNFGANSNLNVSAGTGTAGIYAANTQFNGAVNVADGGTLVLDGDFSDLSKKVTEAGHGKGNFVANAGSSFNIDGTLVVGNGQYQTAIEGDASTQGSTTLDLSQADRITGSGNLKVQGTAVLTDTLLEDFLDPTNLTNEQGGNVDLNNGTLEIKSDNQVDLSDYTYSDKTTKKHGVIALTGTDNTIKGTNIAVSEQLDKVAKDKLNIEAENLVLGNNAATDDIPGLNFKQATVTKSVEFEGTATSKGRLILSNNNNIVVNAVDNGQGDQATSKGNVFIQNDANASDHTIHVKGGTLTHSDGLMKLSTDGDILVGGVSDTSDAAYGKDAALVFGENSSLEMGGANTHIDIKSNGSGAVSSLDLRQATITTTRGDYGNKINVGAAGTTGVDAKLKLNDTQLPSLFGANASTGIVNPNVKNLAVVVEQTGAVQVSDTTADDKPVELDVTAMGSGDGTAPNATNGIFFHDGGRLEVLAADGAQGEEVLGDLLLKNRSTQHDSFLDIGQGTIAANKLTVQNYYATQGEQNDFVMKNGTLEVGADISAADPNTALVLGSGNATNQGANLLLKSSATDVENTIDADIVLNAASSDKAKLNVAEGTWNVAEGNNISFSGSGSIAIGSNEDGAAAAALNMTSQTLDVTAGNHLDINKTGSLQVNELKVASGINVGVEGELHVNTMDLASNSAGAISGSGTLYVGEVGYDDADPATLPEAKVSFNEAHLRKFIAGDGAGHIVLQDNATLDLSSVQSINLNTGYSVGAFDPAGETKPQIAINADTVNATIAGNKLTVEESLVAAGESALNLDLEANNLNLGGTTYDSAAADAAGLGFGSATVKKGVTFTDANGAFHLKNDITIDATNATASSKGNVSLEDGKTYAVHDGNITHSGNFTLAQGNLEVGNDSTNNLGEDASFAMADGTNFTIDNTNGNNNITIAGNGTKVDESDPPAATAEGKSTLDLTKTPLDVVRGTNLATVKVGTTAEPEQAPLATDSTLKLMGEQLNEMLGSNTADATTQGVGVVIGQSGRVEAQGDVTLDLSQLGAGDTATSDKISFNQGGVLDVSGSVTLSNNQQTPITDLGQGTIQTDGLKLSGADTNFAFTNGSIKVDASQAQDTGSADAPVVALGAANEGESGQSVQLGDGTQTGNVNLAFKGQDSGYYAVNADLNLQSAAEETGSVNVSFESGNWTAQNIEVSGAHNSITIGTDDGSIPSTNNTTLSAHDITLAEGAALDISGNKLTVSGHADFTQGVLTGDAALVADGSNNSDTEQAKISLNLDNFKDFVTKDDTIEGDTESSITLQSGGELYLQGEGTLDLATDVKLSADLTSNDADIMVSGTGVNGQNNIIGADNLKVSTNLTTESDQALALDLKAQNLTLGGGETYDNTKGFGFGSSTATNVTFANGGADQTAEVVLREQLKLSSIDETDPNAPTAGTGTSTGNVTLAGNSKGNSLHVKYGNYTHTGNITVSGGTLELGGGDKNIDTTLAINGKFALANNDADNTINVTGNGLGSKTTLDLSNANVSGTGADSNLTSININGGDNSGSASVKLNGDALNAILAAEGSSAPNVGFVLGENGTLDVSNTANDGAVTINADSLGSGDTAERGKLLFNNGGTLQGDDLIFAASTGSSELDIGAGTIAANNLTLSGSSTEGTDSKFTLAEGTIKVNESLNTNASELVIGNGSGKDTLILGGFEVDPITNAVDAGSLSPDTGTVGAGSDNFVLSLNGTHTPADVETNTAESFSTNLEVQHGSWTVNGDINASGSAITVGKVDAQGQAYLTDANDPASAVTAELKAQDLTLSDSKLLVNTTGSANFDSLTSTGSADIDVLGTLNIDSNVNLSAEGGDNITVTGSNATVAFGSGASANITFNEDGSLNTVSGAGGAFDKVFDLVDGGNLKLELGNSTLSMDGIAALRKALLTDSTEDGTLAPNAPVDGYIHLGGAKINGISDKIIEVPVGDYEGGSGEGGTAPSISFDGEDVSELLADIKDIRTDELDNVIITEVTEEDQIEANIGAIELSGSGTTATIKDATLSHAYNPDPSNPNGDRYFVYNENGEMGGAHIVSDGSLRLENSGHIGDITMDAGTTGKTQLVINQGTKDYGDGTTYITSVSGGTNTRFEVNDITQVANDVNIGDLTNNSDLSIGNDLNVGGDLAQNGQLTVGNNLNVSGSATLGQDSVTTVESGSATFAQGAILMDGSKLNVNSGSATFGGDAIVLNGAEINASGAQFDGSAIFAGNANFTADATFNQGLQQTAQSKISGTNITINGDSTIAGTIEGTGNGTFALTDEQVAAGDEINLAQGSNVKFDGDVSFSGNTKLSTGSSLSANGASFTGTTAIFGSGTFGTNGVSFDGNTTVNAGSLITSQGDVNASGDSFTLASGAGISGSGAANFNATTNTIEGTALFEGDVNAGGNDFTLASGAGLKGANITFNSTNTTLHGTVNATGDVNASGDTFTLDSGSGVLASGGANITANTIDLKGTASFAGDANFTGTTSTLASGAGLKGANITFNSTNTTLQGTINATGDVNASGDTFSLDSGSVVLASGGANITANTIDLAGHAAFEGDVTLNGAVSQKASSQLQGDNLTINSTSNTVDLAGTNSFTGAGNIVLNGVDTKVNLAGSNSFGGDLTVEAETITTGTQLTAANGQFTGNTTFNGRNAFTGDLTLNGRTELTSGSSLQVNGDLLTFNGEVQQEAGSSLTTGANNVTHFNNESGSVTSVLAGNNKFNEVHFNGNYEHTGQLSANTMHLDGTLTLKHMGNTIETLHATEGALLQVGTDTLAATDTTPEVPDTPTVPDTPETPDAGTETPSTPETGAEGTTPDAGTETPENGAEGGSESVAQALASRAGTSAESASASVNIGQLDLNGGTLYVDPDYGQQASLAAIERGVDGQFSGSTVLNGNIVIGKNAAAAWGEDLNALSSDIKPYQDANGSLKNSNKPGEYGAIFVVAQPLTVQNGSHITINADASTSDLASSDAISKLSNGNNADLTLSKQSALIVKLAAVGGAEDNEQTAIHFDKDNATIKSTGGDIVLAGNFDSRKEINIFKDNGAEGSEGVYLEGEDINVYSQNHVLKATIEAGDNAGYGVRLTTTKSDLQKNFYHASQPVQSSLLHFQNDANVTGSSAFLSDVLANDTTHGQAAEQAARLGVYGGAMQAAMAVSNSQVDAIARRTGIGEATPGGASFMSRSNNTFWATPIYTSIDSSGFDAEGVSHGADVDLFGLSAGAELSLNPNLKVGALFSFGQGSADGTGVASGVSNDFDYYGLGAYVTSRYGDFTVVGDINYSSLSNDVDTNTSIDKLNTSFDTEVISLGVTGKMDLKFQGFNVAPHAGLRLQHIDMDDYGVKSAKHGQVASYSADTMDVFSLPVGVSFSKDFITSSGWQLKPAVDLTITANFGDTDANGSVAWTGTNVGTSLSSEVLDPLTVGINAGLSIKKNNFSFGAGVNYTGSSNSDEFGIQATARFDF